MKFVIPSNLNSKEKSKLSNIGSISWGNLTEDVQEKCSIPILPPTSLFFFRNCVTDGNTKFATYTSVWDGCLQVTSSCIINTATHEVVYIQFSEIVAEKLNELEYEYVTFNDAKHSIYRKYIQGIEKIFYED